MTKTDAAKPVVPSPMANNVVPLPAAVEEPTPSEKVVSFIKRHPVLSVAGAVAAGVAVSALLPRKSRRSALGKALGLAEAAAATPLTFGREAAGKAGQAGHTAAKKLEKYTLTAITAASAIGSATAKRAGELGETAADKAARVGQSASGHSHKAIRAACHLRRRITR